MSLYPSLEDMKVDKMAQAQVAHIASIQQQQPPTAPPSMEQPTYPYPVAAGSGAPSAPGYQLYPALTDYMGLDLSPELLSQHNVVAVPPQLQVPAVPTNVTDSSSSGNMVAPLSGSSLGLQRAQVTHGIRELVLCKDAKGKVGLRVRGINKGVFVVLVERNSPAALGGLRFGDQILQINGENVAGYDTDKVHNIFKKCAVNNIQLAVRDRPFERTVTLHKDSVGSIGFGFKDGKIVSLVKDSSAARNGLLTEHNLLEVNGQNVVGLKDKEVTKIIEAGGQIVTITVMPNFIFQHMMKCMASSLVKGSMDHSIPAV